MAFFDYQSNSKASCTPATKASSSSTPPPAKMQKVTTAALALDRATTAFTRSVILGYASRMLLSKKDSKSTSDVKVNEMKKALTKVHAVFKKFALHSPRFRQLDESETMLDMQMQAYMMGSRSSRVVAQRARASESFSWTSQPSAGRLMLSRRSR